MAINVDLSKPLTKDQIEDLRTRLPENLVQHYISQAGQAEEKDVKMGSRKPDILT